MRKKTKDKIYDYIIKAEDSTFPCLGGGDHHISKDENCCFICRWSTNDIYKPVTKKI